MTASLNDDFKKNKYVIVRNVLSKETFTLINNYLSLQEANGYFSPDHDFPSTKYLDLVMQSLLQLVQPQVEGIVEKKLFPTYSHVRIYSYGDFLPAHTDQVACEYSVTLALNRDCDFLWPIFVMNGEEKVDAFLDRGDMLIYKGCEVIHGRDKFFGKNWTQVFLHYVDQAGDYADWIYDKNPSIHFQPLPE